METAWLFFNVKYVILTQYGAVLELQWVIVKNKWIGTNQVC